MLILTLLCPDFMRQKMTNQNYYAYLFSSLTHHNLITAFFINFFAHYKHNQTHITITLKLTIKCGCTSSGADTTKILSEVPAITPAKPIPGKKMRR